MSRDMLPMHCKRHCGKRPCDLDTQDSGKVSDERICEIVQTFYDLTPRGIIEYLDLRRPIYAKTSAGGHFGRSEPEFKWESTADAAKLAAAVRA